MAGSEWERRIVRAKELGAHYSFAAEVLRFYGVIACFQEEFYEELGRSFERSSAGAGSVASDPGPFAQALHPELIGRFETFLALVEQNGPDPLQEAARELRDGGDDSHFQLLTVFCYEGESSVRDGGKRIMRSFPYTPRRNSSTSAWKLAIVARATSRQWTLRKADSPNLLWTKWLRSRSICGRRTRDTRSCNAIFYSFEQKNERTI